MRKTLLLCLVGMGLFLNTNAQKKDKDTGPKAIETDAGILQKMMDNYHCSPRKMDEQYLKDIAYLFTTNLDPLHIYFTKDDVAKLNDYNAIKEALMARSNSYLTSATAIYKQSLERAEGHVNAALTTPFDFTVDEKFVAFPDSAGYAATQEELKKRVYHTLKFTALNRMIESAFLDSTLTKAQILGGEAKEREVAGKIRLRRINRLLNSRWGFENLVKLLLNDAVLKANDPHSAFIPEMMEQRRASFFNGSAVAFGLKLTENNKGDVIVEGLVPKSSAWKSGVISKDDILVSMQWEHQQVIDLEGADQDEVEAFFAEKRYRHLKLTVRKTDGELKTASLSKGRFFENSSAVESFLLQGTKKVGYVIMPSFYGDWDRPGGASCVREMSKDLEKLQFEAEGLIIDMRYNGGGSLDEANQMAGLFIDEGPLGFLKKRGGFSEEMKDPMLGTSYPDPVIVLVNNESASATEYVAGVLQDYNRAIIVGSPTFGKATGQRVLPADTSIHRADMNRGNYDSQAKDFVKITLAKLYRVTGNNNQLIGVQPDIGLPSVFDSIHYREQHMRSPLSLDTLKRKGVYEPFNPLPIAELKAKSEARVKTAAQFDLVRKGAELFRNRRKVEHGALPLQYDKLMELSKKYLDGGRKLVKKIVEGEANVFKVSNWVYQKPTVEPDVTEIEANNKILDLISKDAYVQEAYYIMSDWLDLKKGKK